MTDQVKTRMGQKEEIRPLFYKYMSYMSRFYEVDDYDSWHAGAMTYFDLYDSSADRSIFVLTLNGAILGFAMVNAHLRFNRPLA